MTNGNDLGFAIYFPSDMFLHDTAYISAISDDSSFSYLYYYLLYLT